MPPLAACLGLAIALASCSPEGFGVPRGLRGHELRLALPNLPPSWARLGGVRMSVSWRDPAGGLRSAEAEPGSFLRVELRRGFPQAILARPFAGGRSLLPAGALYPESLAAGGGDADELELDWKGGYAASLAAALEGGGIDPSGYDLLALAEGAAARSGDPWLVPSLEAARHLAEGSFRIDLYKKPPRFGVELRAHGTWAPESPFAPAPEGSSALLPAGLWRFIGAGGELLVSVDADGKATEVERP